MKELRVTIHAKGNRVVHEPNVHMLILQKFKYNGPHPVKLGVS